MKNKTFLICAHCGSIADTTVMLRLEASEQRQQTVACCQCSSSRFFITSLSPAIFDPGPDDLNQWMKVN